jgi:putative PIN family toxin of toxin-antitoxin system
VGATEATLKVVLDTNTVVSATLFGRGALTWIRHLWEGGAIRPLVGKATIEELVRVLAYPRFRLDEDEIALLMASFISQADVVDASRRWPRGVPRCTDPDDDMFLALAARGRARVLVSGDRALLSLAGRAPFAIEAPAAFRRRFPTA